MKSLVFILALMSVTTSAQTFQDQAARLQNIHGFLLDFRPVSAPYRPEKNRIEISIDVNVQPTVEARVGNKDEPLDPPSVVPKLRGRFLSKQGIMVGAAFAPGVEYQDYEAEYVSFELGWRFRLAGIDMALRSSYTDGEVLGPITTPDAQDLFSFQNKGLDISLGKSYSDWHVYVFGGGISIDTDLDIEEDGVHMFNEESTYYGGAGVTILWRAISLSLEQNVTDDYLQNVIMSLGYRF